MMQSELIVTKSQRLHFSAEPATGVRVVDSQKDVIYVKEDGQAVVDNQQNSNSNSVSISEVSEENQDDRFLRYLPNIPTKKQQLMEQDMSYGDVDGCANNFPDSKEPHRGLSQLKNQIEVIESLEEEKENANMQENHDVIQCS